MKKFKRFLKTFVFLTAMFVMIFSINSFLDYSSDNTEQSMKLFFNEPKNSLDVIYMGASTVKAGILPTKIYEKTGLTGYSVGYNNLPVCLFKPLIEQCEKTQNPKLYIIDINNLSYFVRDYFESSVKYTANALPDKRDSQKIVSDLLDSDERLNYSFDLYRNHYNWERLSFIIKGRKLGVDRKVSVIKGWRALCSHFSGEGDYIDISDNYEIIDPLNGEGNANLIKNYEIFMQLLDFIDENAINVCFIRTPRFTDKDNLFEFKICNYYAKILQERGFIYKDFSRDMSKYSTSDFYNIFHLNLYGAEKFSDTLADFIIENHLCDNPSHSEKTDSDWTLASEKFDKFADYLKLKENDSEIFVSDLAYFSYEKYNYIKYC